jgi:hypothetical protein
MKSFAKYILLSTLLSVIFSYSGYAQFKVKGRIFNSITSEPLAFVTVMQDGTQNGTFTDIDGYFSLNLPDRESLINFSYVGFNSEKLVWNGSTLWEVRLTPLVKELRVATITAGENPGERIMRKVIRWKDKNNPEKSTAFIYNSYNKLVIMGDPDSTELEASSATNSLDSTSIKMRTFFKEKHLYMMESATQRRHLPPGKDEEVILASRVSGFKAAPFALLGTQLQSFSVYEDNLMVLDISYLSPISGSAISKYFFHLEDSTLIGADTVYTISFHPRKGKNFNGLVGSLTINSNGWAVQNIIASPADTGSSVQIKIQQQYTRFNSTWFPEQLNSFLSFPNMSVNGVNIVGVSHSYIRDLELNAQLKRSSFGPVTLRMDPKAADVPDSLWNIYRQHSLDVKEAATYGYLDSVGKAENFEQKLKIINILATGKIPMGKLSWDIDRFFRANDFEGLRLGAGLHTNDFLSRVFSLGGYYAYGFKDQGHKYGGDLLFHLYCKRNAWIQFVYEQDVKETGGNIISNRKNAFLSNNFYPIFISAMDEVEKMEVRINGRLVGNLSSLLFANYQTVSTVSDYRFLVPKNEQISVLVRNFSIYEAGVGLRWAPGEKLALMGDRELSLGSKWPLFFLRYTMGRTDISNERSSFQRFDAEIEKTFRMALTGDFSVRVTGGWVPYNLPAHMNYNAQGTNTNSYNHDRYVGLAAPYTFETMRTNEFIHSRVVQVHFRHSFKDLLFKSGKFKPLLSVVQNMCWGDIENPASHTIIGRQAKEGFFESGLVIDQLMKSAFSGIGLGVFYRYGPYAGVSTEDNIVVKISTNISF